MNESLVLTKESFPSDIERYFRSVLALDQQDKVFSVNLDDVWQLVYTEKGKAVRALKANFIENVDFLPIAKDGKRSGDGKFAGGGTDYYLTSACLEYFVARKVRSVFEIYRQVFHKVAQTFAVPQTFAEALMLAAKQQQAIEEQQRQTEEKNTEIVELSTAITTMQPKVSYVDTILQCKDTVQTTIIAQDYGKSAKAFNILLRNFGIQRKVGTAWVLYAKHIANGYVQSKTFTYKHKDGTDGARTYSEWTQRGRLFLYDTLKKHGILPMIEQ